MKRFARKSIRWRLLVWLALLLAVVLSALAAAAYQLARVTQLNQIDEALRVRVAALLTDIRRLPVSEAGSAAKVDDFSRRPAPPPPGVKVARPHSGKQRRSATSESGELTLSHETSRHFNVNDATGYYYGVWLANGTGSKLSANAGMGLMLPAPPASNGPLYVRTRDTYREAFFFTDRGDCVLAGLSVLPYQAGLDRFAFWLVAAALAVLIAGLETVGWLVGRALRPVDVIASTAERIAMGSLAERINVRETESELGRLAGVLNTTFARLESAFARQEKFTADAAHELRTPLTVLISEAQATLARDRSIPEYRQSLEECLAAAQQMRRLAESLLELSRFDAGQETMQRAPMDLADVAREAIDLVSSLAEARKITIHRDLAPTPMVADAIRLRQVATNLLTNAIDYNRPGGEVWVTTLGTCDSVLLRVQNTGAGISAEDVPRIFDRFYRADKARGNSGAHHGLGLAISKTIVEAHGGSIEATSTSGVGATLSVRLPK